MEGRLRRSCAAISVFGALFASSGPSFAEPHSITYHLTARVSTGGDDQGFVFFDLMSASGEAVAMVSEGRVSLLPSQFTAPLLASGGFAGAVANAAGEFAAGGGVPTFECGSLASDEACIAGGGFGGAMALTGVSYEGLSLDLWGLGGERLSTQPGPGPFTTGRVQAEPWTVGRASAWFYLSLIDPTPFRTTATGTFRGLPSTYTGTDAAGFTLVSPMVVADLTNPQRRARGIAKLEIRFVPEPSPMLAFAAGIAALIAMAHGVRRRDR